MAAPFCRPVTQCSRDRRGPHRANLRSSSRVLRFLLASEHHLSTMRVMGVGVSVSVQRKSPLERSRQPVADKGRVPDAVIDQVVKEINALHAKTTLEAA